VHTSLHTLLNPKSVVLIGASERSAWSNTAFRNLQSLGFQGEIHLVNRKGGEVYGQKAFTSLADIGRPIDLALLMVPADVVEQTLADMHAAGVRSGVLLASGFAETGDAGRAHQERIIHIAKEYGIALLGPNCVGFINFVGQASAFTITPYLPVIPGSLAVVSQSGAVGNLVAQFAHRQNIGLSYLITSGNEADVDSGRLIDYLVDDPATTVIALFLETVRNTATFSAAAARALAAGKPIVVLKVGASEVTVKSAMAHTGSLVGDDRVFDAVCRKLGVVRVQSIEALVTTAEVMSRLGILKKSGLGIASISGGICEIMGDRAEIEGVSLPELSGSTQTRLKEILPDFGTAHNPLDVTGAIILRPDILGDTVKILSEETAFGALITVLDVPTCIEEERAYSRPALHSIQTAAADASIPCLTFSHSVQSMTEHSRNIVRELGLNYLSCGIHVGLAAVAKAFAWSKQYRLTREQPRAEATASSETSQRPRSEFELLKYLGTHGVPVVPQELVVCAADAVRAANNISGPCALKIASVDIPHKTEVGGVMLNLEGSAAVAAGFNQLMERVEHAAPQARLDGVIVSPMRKDGIELFVGIHDDPQWGRVVAVGLGGVWVEVLKDTSLRTLPVNEDDVVEMLSELRGARLLDEFRGRAGVDRLAIARAVVAIANAAQSFGAALSTLEINPMLATAAKVEALDALAVWH
jgi:acyl-CoA synthetase (NDP forming)